MNEINKDFRQEREDLNLTQQDAAMLLNVSRITYIKWEQEPDTMPIGKYELLKREFERLKQLTEEQEYQMLGWAAVIESGELVHTLHGTGKVRRVSENQKTAQVDIDGQLFDVPLDTITKQDGGVSPHPESPPEGADFDAPPPAPQELKVGDNIQAVGKPHITGRVTEVTQRSIKGKFDVNGGTPFTFPKSDVKAGKHIEELKPVDDHKQPAEKPDQPKANLVEGLRHKQLEQLITYAAMRLSPLLVGMAGTGKTHAGEQTARALGLPFYSMSVGAQTSKSDIIGYQDASGRYVGTHFREAYENGGVFLMDEIDAGNANVLIQINAALSNGLCAFPDRMVSRHDDFIFIASANTFGNGANRQYVGRNQLDAATLDRFALIEWFIDDDLEENLTVGLNGKAWYMAVRACRDYVAEKNIRALISPRATQKGSKLLDVGQDVTEVIGATLLGSVPDDKKADVTQVATSIFNKFASAVPSKLSRAVNPEVRVTDLIR